MDQSLENKAVIVEIDGYRIDAETGEVVSIATPKPQFTVSDESAAEWVLERMSVEDAEIGALEARRAALLQNMEAMIGDRKRRLGYLHFRFDNELAEYARQHLAKGKKTWTAPFGSVAFRTKPANVKVTDEEKALEAARTRWPEAIKTTEKFLIASLPAAAKAMLLENPDEAPGAGLEVVPEVETISIKTGVS
jgi:phage host-nuclease inhibitor protein Gam